MTRTIHFLRIAFGIALFVFVLEFCARLDDFITYRAPIGGTYGSDKLYENDQLGKRGKPFASYRKWHLNEFGYRGPRFEQDRLHIVSFGASETFGLYESDEREYPRQLEQMLNEHAGKPLYQVVNVAYPGQTVSTMTLRVPEIVARIHPQIALIYVSPALYIYISSHHSPQPVQADAPGGFEFRITDRLRETSKTMLPEFFQTMLRSWEIGRTMGSDSEIDRVPEESVNLMREDLLGLIDALRAYGVQPIIITHATIFGDEPRHPDRAMLIAWRKFYPKLKEEGFLDLEQRMNQAMRDVAVRQRLPLVDIAREVPPGSEYFADFVHFTDAGSAVVARQIADAVEGLSQQLPNSAEADAGFRKSRIADGEVVSR